MPKNSLPSVSVVIPTLNSAKTLRDCLQSITMQDYPRDRIEIIIADGGSTDRTLEIIKSWQSAVNSQDNSATIDCRLMTNRLKTGEAGKAVGLKHAKNDIIAFIDSDNILPDEDWLKRMVEPFNDPEIIATEPIEYTYRPDDGYITRYCALIGMNDPLCLFLGNYDRYSTLTGQWTEITHQEEDKGGYLKIEFNKGHLPTIGANGFLIRRSALERCNIGDYLFDIDIIYELLTMDYGLSTISNRFAKVKTGIIHIFSGDIKTFARKQRRRIMDYQYYNKLGVRKYPWGRINKIGLGKFMFSCLFLFPLLVQSIKGYLKKPDRAWFFHPIACWITLWEYGWGRIGGIFCSGEFKREEWRQ